MFVICDVYFTGCQLLYSAEDSYTIMEIRWCCVIKS